MWTTGRLPDTIYERTERGVEQMKDNPLLCKSNFQEVSPPHQATCSAQMVSSLNNKYCSPLKLSQQTDRRTPPPPSLSLYRSLVLSRYIVFLCSLFLSHYIVLLCSLSLFLSRYIVVLCSLSTLRLSLSTESGVPTLILTPCPRHG